MSPGRDEFKKRLAFSIVATLDAENSMGQESGKTPRDLEELTGAVVSEATELIALAEEIGAQLEERWLELGQPSGTIVSWWRQELGFRLSDTPTELLQKARNYLK